jgi:hypothetical protein
VVLPPTVPASLGYMAIGGCYLLDNGNMLVLWLGREAPAAWLTQVGGEPGALMHGWGMVDELVGCPDVHCIRCP